MCGNCINSLPVSAIKSQLHRKLISSRNVTHTRKILERKATVAHDIIDIINCAYVLYYTGTLKDN